MVTRTSSITSPFSLFIYPKHTVLGFLSERGRVPLPAGVKILSVMAIASGPDTRIIPIAPPVAVAIAHIVSWLFIVDCLFSMVSEAYFPHAMPAHKSALVNKSIYAVYLSLCSILPHCIIAVVR